MRITSPGLGTTAFIAVLMLVNLGCASLVSLYYDDGSAEDALWINGLRGHAVVFQAPSDNWTLSGIEIFGKAAPNPDLDMFVIEVWDSNLSLLSRTVDVTKSYFGDNFTWSVVDIPDLKVSGSFVVSFYEFSGVYVGADLSSATGRSMLTARNPNRIAEWTVPDHPWNQTSWVIRALGSSPVPVVSTKLLSDKASQSSPARVQVKAEDPDANLKSATLYVVDNKTGEIVWSEIGDLKGESSEAQLSWPGTAFQVSGGSVTGGPVLVNHKAGLARNVSDLMTYAAPCLLNLEKNITFSATAYFGEDGKLHALVDSYGGAPYISRDLLNRTMPGADYVQYFKQNVSVVKDQSTIVFFTMKLPLSPQQSQTAEVIGPIVLSGSPLFNYGIKLQEVPAGAGDYIAVVEAADSAFNTALGVGDKVIKVA